MSRVGEKYNILCIKKPYTLPVGGVGWYTTHRIESRGYSIVKKLLWRSRPHYPRKKTEYQVTEDYCVQLDTIDSVLLCLSGHNLYVATLFYRRNALLYNYIRNVSSFGPRIALGWVRDDQKHGPEGPIFKEDQHVDQT